MGLIAWYKEKRIDSFLGRLESESNVELRGKAAWRLGKIGDARVVDPLIRTLQHDQSVEVRKWAARALGDLKDNRAIDPLIRMLGDKEEGVRDAAVDALGDFRKPKVVYALYSAIKAEEKDYIREKMQKTMRKIDRAE